MTDTLEIISVRRQLYLTYIHWRIFRLIKIIVVGENCFTTIVVERRPFIYIKKNKKDEYELRI
jgi:hypothetical protein